MKAEFLFLFIKATKCHSHCRHCMTHPAESSAVMDSGAILESIDRFSRYARQVGTSLAVQLGDCPLDHADFPMILGRMKEQDVDGWTSIAVNGFGFREDYGELAARIAGSPARRVEFTLYGVKGDHDRFAGRRNDYTEITRLARACDAEGVDMAFKAFVTKTNMRQIDELRAEVDSMFGREVELDLFRYVGAAAALEEMRLDADDLEVLKRNYSAEYPGYLSEKGWLVEGVDEEPQEAVVRVVLDQAGVLSVPYCPASAGHRGTVLGAMDGYSLSELMDDVARVRQDYISSHPPVAELATRVGDSQNARAYDHKSMIELWRARYRDCA